MRGQYNCNKKMNNVSAVESNTDMKYKVNSTALFSVRVCYLVHSTNL